MLGYHSIFPKQQLGTLIQTVDFRIRENRVLPGFDDEVDRQVRLEIVVCLPTTCIAYGN